MSVKEIYPFSTNKFTCPICGTFADQSWYQAEANFHDRLRAGYTRAEDIALCFCHSCTHYTVWKGDEMVYPDHLIVDAANADLSDEIKNDYNEAASILSKSPRGSAALLRLVIQKLCRELGCDPTQTIDRNIAELVRRGLNPKMQKSLDVVRVIGNEAVHPGQMDLKDDFETAEKLFAIVNIIAREMISDEKDVDVLYNSLPSEKLEAIKKRDS